MTHKPLTIELGEGWEVRVLPAMAADPDNPDEWALAGYYAFLNNQGSIFAIMTGRAPGLVEVEKWAKEHIALYNHETEQARQPKAEVIAA